MVLSPWAFGTTQEWAIWTLNTIGYALGCLWLCKRWLRVRTGYCPPRWGEEVAQPGQPALFRPHTKCARWLTRSLALLTVLVLGYGFLSAANARAWFGEPVPRFNERYLPWLPHSYAGGATWFACWQYLALACVFWATRDWLLGKTPRESGEEEAVFPEVAPRAPTGLPERLSRLLWVLCLNGTLLGAVAILQRLDGTDRLLWVLLPRFGGADFHFGPFTYRGNGAQYFNLLWPVSLAFWWTLFHASRTVRTGPARLGNNPHLVLLPCVLVQIACPIISASSGGVVIAIGLAVGALAVLLAANWSATSGTRAAMAAPFVLAILLVAYLGWSQIQGGLGNAFMDDLGDRVEIYQNARKMAVDHPLFGTGPGTFGTMYQLYRASPREDWAAYAHDDWLQTVITFGWLGFALIVLMLAHAFARWWWRDGIACRWDLATMIWLALAGCLFHARFDFPFQIYSLLLLFLVLCAISVCLARPQ